MIFQSCKIANCDFVLKTPLSSALGTFLLFSYSCDFSKFCQMNPQLKNLLMTLLKLLKPMNIIILIQFVVNFCISYPAPRPWDESFYFLRHGGGGFRQYSGFLRQILSWNSFVVLFLIFKTVFQSRKTMLNSNFLSRYFTSFSISVVFIYFGKQTRNKAESGRAKTRKQASEKIKIFREILKRGN